MRLAKRGDYWRRIYEREYPTKLDSLRFENILALGTGDIPFSGGITAICGGNGVGKTTLLDAILGSIDAGRTSTPAISRMRLVGCTLKAQLTIDGELVEKSSSFNPATTTTDAEPVLEVTWLDPATQSVKLITLFSDMKNLDELLEAYSPRDLDEAELKLLSYVIGKDYDSCQVYEIDDYSNEPTFPYFRVVSNQVQYGSETMGFGEMSLHLMWWYLKRTPPNSILLIEEPETYVSPRSQSALMDMVAKFALENGIWVILTTHSPTIVSEIPLEHVRLLFRDAGSVRLITAPSRSQLESIFGIIPQHLGVLFLEDGVACQFLQALFRFLSPDLLAKFEIVNAGSEGNIAQALRNFPRVGSWLKIIGVFDGDGRARINERYEWPHIFLPGDSPPEVVLMSAVRGNTERLATKIARDTGDVALILGQLEGLDHHDWFEELRKRSFISAEQLMNGLVEVWLESNVGRAAANEFVAIITTLIADMDAV